MNNRGGHNRLNLAGFQFGSLLVLHATEMRDSDGSIIWCCRCKCGKKTGVRTSHLQGKTIKSCGCTKGSNFKTHGKSGTFEHRVWKGMLQRCNDPSHSGFHKYGGRGIVVCDRWSKFENFLLDMGMSPSKHSIDRIDNDGNYSPENCRWATPHEQARNKRNSIWLTYNSERLHIREWAERLGIGADALRYRLKHMFVEQALTRKRYAHVK